MKIGVFHTAFVGDIILAGLLFEVLHNAGHAPVLFTKFPHGQVFQHDSRLSHVVYVDKGIGWKKVKRMWQIVKAIRAEQCSVLLVPHKSFTSTLCAFLSGVKIRIGFKNASCAFLYTKTVPYEVKKHECLRLLSFAQALGIVLPIGLPQRTILRTSQEQCAVVCKKLRLPAGPFFIIAPGSAWATKKYPLASWVCVLKGLADFFPTWQGVILGGPGDTTDALFLQQACSNLLNLCGKMTLDESCALVSMAQLVLCNDSAPTHMASGFNIPVVSVFGPTVEAFGFGPCSDKRALVTYASQFNAPLPCQPCGKHGAKTCPLGHHQCMKNLDPATVLFAVCQLFN